MLHSVNFCKLSYEYDQLLIRDLGFCTKPWEPMISKIVSTLGIEPDLRGVTLTEATKNPGPFIIESLITRWTSERGKYWVDLVRVDKYSGSSPYHDYIEYGIYIKTPEEFLKELQSQEVYNNYELIRSIFESRDYEILRELHGTKITIT